MQWEATLATFYNETEDTYPYSAAMASETGEEFYRDSYDYSTESYVISFFGRLNYSILDRYLLTLTLRNDGHHDSARITNGIVPRQHLHGASLTNRSWQVPAM